MKKIITACLLSIVFLLPLHSFAQNTATLKGKVTDNKGNPLTGANISLVSIQRGAVANKTGHYTIDNISPGKYTVRVSFIGYKKKQQKISFKAGQTVIRNFKLRKSAITSQGVTVIGSRASHASTTDLAVPVQRISYQEINDISGTPNTNQMLERVSPTINSPHTSNQDGTSAVQPLTVRGLSPDQTLVMIDGVRRHPTALVHRLTTGGVQEGSSGVDFGAIPSIAISDIDILKSGAAAQYGSAAIAGVINLKLKKGPIKPKIIGRYGEYTPDNWPDGGEKYNLSGQYSFSLGDRGFLNVFGQFSHREPITRAGADPRDQLQPGDGDIVDSNGNVVKKNNPVPQPDFMRGNGKSTDVYAWWNGQYSLSEESNTKLYTYGGYSHRNTLNFGFYRRALGNRDWPSIYPLGFLPQFKDPIKDASGTVGIKGTILGGWHYDLNSVLGYNRYEFHITNSMNVSYGPNIPPNQTSFYAGAEHLIESTSEFSLKKEVDFGLPNPVNVALGVNFRYDNWGTEAGEPKSYDRGPYTYNQNNSLATPGAQVFPGFTPQNAIDRGRTNLAVYADLESHLSDSFLADIAGRFESYSDFGQLVVGKLALRYQPIKQIAFRTSISNGFRAPNLSQEYFSKISTIFTADKNTGQISPHQVGLFRTTSKPAKALGAKPLEPEKSINFSGGIVFTPLPNFTFTANYYLIRINKRIILSGTLSGPEVSQLLSPYGATEGSFFSNAIDTKSQGIDMTANYRTRFNSQSSLHLSGSFEYNTESILGHVRNPDVLGNQYREQIMGLDTRTTFTKGRPLTKTIVTAQYQIGDFDLNLTGTRYGEFTLGDTVPSQVQTFQAKTIFNTRIGVQLTNDVKWSIGANNIFDIFPDRTISANQYHGIFLYPSASPWGMGGRFLYSKIELTL